MITIKFEHQTRHGRFVDVYLWFGYGEIFVEVKPTVADDYPNVLRQMKQNGSTVLFLEQYNGSGATLKQFVEVFAMDKIKVVFLQDVIVE